MNEYEKNMDPENSPIMEALIRCLRENQPQAQILNLSRYREMLVARKTLHFLLQESWQDADTTIRFFPEFSAASLSAEVDSFEVCDKDAFALLAEKADNFEIVPLLNGRLRISFMFYRMMTRIDQQEE